MIVLGPFIAASSYDTPRFDDFVGTGFALELYINGNAHTLLIFKDTSYWRGERPGFIDYYLLSRDDEWPFEFDSRNFQQKRFGEFYLVRISPFLRALFTEHNPGTDIIDFLKDFRAALLVASDCDSGNPYRPQCEIALTEELVDAGFSVTRIVHHGKTLAVELAWSFQDEHPTWKKIHAGRMTFTVAEAMIRKPVWKPHHWEESIEDLFWQKLRKVAPKEPAACFASVAELDKLLLHIEWEPTLTLNADELQKQRHRCIAESPGLWDQPLELARFLLGMNLYASSTTPWQIAKTVVKTVAELRSHAGSSRPTTLPNI